MGMLGQYIMVDEDTLEGMMAMDGAALMGTLEPGYGTETLRQELKGEL
jgi:hypothetical protein